VTVSPDSSHAEVQLRLNWYTPDQRKADYASAVNAARHAKRAVVFAWARVNPVFQLPGDQNQLIEDVAAVNPNTIVVLNTSQPVALPWIDKVKAVLQMWWPGDEGGWSTANLLLGKTSPAGRLPVSWGHRLEDYPATDPRFPERGALGVNGKTTYSEGLDVGYRWFEHEKREPLFAFGFGLSYTKFDYSQLEVQRASDGGLDVSATIHNTGAVDSDEVPQVYLGAPEKIPAGVHFALHTLGGFDRVHLGAGQSTRVILHVPQRQLQYWSTAEDKWVTASGKRVVSMGLSSRELLLNAVIEMP